MKKTLTIIIFVFFTELGFTQTYTPFSNDVEVDSIISTLVDEYIINNLPRDTFKLCLTPVNWTDILGRGNKDTLDYSQIDLIEISDLQIDSLLGNYFCWYERQLKDSISIEEKKHLIKQLYPRSKENIRWKNIRSVISTNQDWCWGCISFSIPYFIDNDSAIIGVYASYGWRFDRVGWVLMKKENGKWKKNNGGLCWMS